MSSKQQLGLLRLFWASRKKTHSEEMCAGKCLGPIEVSRSMSTDLSEMSIEISLSQDHPNMTAP